MSLVLVARITDRNPVDLAQDSVQRIDRWLHHVCLFKTRTQAARACEERRVKVNGETIKAAKNIRPGDQVTIRYPNGRFVDYQILALAPKSMPKQQARECYDTQERQVSEEMRELLQLFNASYKPVKSKYKGRPTKRERRTMDGFKRKQQT